MCLGYKDRVRFEYSRETFTETQPSTMAKAKVDYLLSVSFGRGIALEEPFRTENGRISAECLCALHHGYVVHLYFGAFRYELSMNCVQADQPWYLTECQIERQDSLVSPPGGTVFSNPLITGGTMRIPS